MLEKLNSEIANLLQEQARWRRHDFNLAQCLFWSAIGASLVVTMAQFALAYPRFNDGRLWPLKFGVALFSAVPAVVLIISQTFRHAERSSWHALYYIKLSDLSRRLNESNVKDISEELFKLQISMQKTFPTLNTPVFPKTSNP